MANLVQLIKKAAMEAVRESKPSDFLYGTVASVEPLSIRINQRLVLSESFLILTNNVKDYTVEISEDDSRREITIHNSLEVGEKVILLMRAGGQEYLVLDRL